MNRLFYAVSIILCLSFCCCNNQNEPAVEKPIVYTIKWNLETQKENDKSLDVEGYVYEYDAEKSVYYRVIEDIHYGTLNAYTAQNGAYRLKIMFSIHSKVNGKTEIRWVDKIFNLRQSKDVVITEQLPISEEEPQ